MEINSKTQLNIVIGHPLEQSRSPILHTSVYQSLNINAVLLAFSNQNLESIIAAIKAFSIGLTAVTMPFKKKILPYLDHLSEEVSLLQSVNTVILRDGKLWGYNTDVFGIAYALRDIPISHKNVLLIGAGGAASAAAYHLQKNAANLWWYNRTYQNALLLSEKFGGKVIEDLDGLSFDIIINTTPLGMHPNVEQSPLPHYEFNSDQIIFDMVYNPIETLLQKQAKSCGALCISGLDMFIGQGLLQIELWLNKPIDLTNMIDSIKSIVTDHCNTVIPAKAGIYPNGFRAAAGNDSATISSLI